MVPGAGIEPARPFGQRILRTTIAFATAPGLDRLHLWSGLSLCPMQTRALRQEPSSLYTFPSSRRNGPGLSSGLPAVVLWEASPNLTPLHREFPLRGPKRVRCVYLFRHPGLIRSLSEGFRACKALPRYRCRETRAPSRRGPRASRARTGLVRTAWTRRVESALTATCPATCPLVQVGAVAPCSRAPGLPERRA